MTRLDEVRVRIEARVPALTDRLGNAGEFSQVIERNQLPQVTPAGYLLPGGLVGGDAALATGLFRQAFEEKVIVVLVVRVAGDALGNAALDVIWPLVLDVVAAVAGWGPENTPGVFVLQQAELVGSKDGALIFQIDFTLQDQLRIVP